MIMMPGGFAGCQRQQCASGPSAAVVRPAQPLLSQAVSAASAPRALSLVLEERLSRATQRPHGARLVSTVPRPVWAWLSSYVKYLKRRTSTRRQDRRPFARMIGRELRNRWTRSDECDRFSLTLPLPPTTVSHNSATAVIWRCLVTSPCTASLADRLATADHLLRPSTCRQSSFIHWSKLFHPSPVLQALPQSSLIVLPLAHPRPPLVGTGSTSATQCHPSPLRRATRNHCLSPSRLRPPSPLPLLAAEPCRLVLRLDHCR